MRRQLTTPIVLALVIAACGGGDESATQTSGSSASTETGSVASTTTTSLAPTTEPAAATMAPTTTTAAPRGYPAVGGSDAWTVEIITSYPHDSTAFTQGLLVDDDVVYESTGLYGESAVRIVDRTSGDVVAEKLLDPQFFGEGLELVDDRLVQLTWQEEVALVWDAATLEQIDLLSYTGQGWGLCDQPERFVMSDGSATLTFRTLDTFEAIGSVEVVRDGAPRGDLNELECVDGLVFANVWKTDEIVVIDPADGDVVATIDAAVLAEEAGVAGDTRAVLNGIAYDEGNGTFLLTGKLWDTVFEVRFVEAAP